MVELRKVSFPQPEKMVDRNEWERMKNYISGEIRRVSIEKRPLPDQKKNKDCPRRQSRTTKQRERIVRAGRTMVWFTFRKVCWEINFYYDIFFG